MIRNSGLSKYLLISTAISLLPISGALFPSFAEAADGFVEDGTTSWTWTTDATAGDDAWAMDSQTGSTTTDITIDASSGNDGTVTITSASGVTSQVFIRNISYADSADGGESNAIAITIGDGNQQATLAVHGNIDLVTDDDVGSTITIDSSGDAQHANLEMYGDSIDLGSTGSIVLNSSATKLASLTMLGTSGDQTVTGDITAAANAEGRVNNKNYAGTVTFNGSLGDSTENALATVWLYSNSNTVFNSTIDTGDLRIDGTATLNDAVTMNEASSTLRLGANSKIILGSGFSSGSTVITMTDTGSYLITSGATVQLPSNFKSGTITLINDDADISGQVANLSVTDTALVDYTVQSGTVSGGSNTDIEIAASEKSTSAVASALGVSAQEATGLTNANTAVSLGDSAALGAMTTALNTGGASATAMAEQVSLQTDILTAAPISMINTGNNVFSLSSLRLSALRSGAQFASASNATGFSAGDDPLSRAVWLKPFGDWVSQDQRDGVEGYSADTYGLTVGVDKNIYDDLKLGASFSYANTDVDGKGTGHAKLDIDSYQLTIYGDYTQEKYYLEGMVGFARNNTDTSRELNFGGLNRTATGDYRSNQYMASLGGGIPINLDGAVYFTPTSAVSATLVKNESYTETGAGNLNLMVGSDDIEAYVLSLGSKLHTTINNGGVVVTPEFRFGANYDFAGNKAEATAQYTGGGAAFNVSGSEVEKLSGHLGIGLTVESGVYSLGFNYDLEKKQDYAGHSLTAEARLQF